MYIDLVTKKKIDSRTPLVDVSLTLNFKGCRYIAGEACRIAEQLPVIRLLQALGQ